MTVIAPCVYNYMGFGISMPTDTDIINQQINNASGSINHCLCYPDRIGLSPTGWFVCENFITYENGDCNLNEQNEQQQYQHLLMGKVVFTYSI